MVKHMIIWKFKDDIPNKAARAAEIKAALELYQSHPIHKEIANGLVRPSMKERLSFDYKI